MLVVDCTDRAPHAYALAKALRAVCGADMCRYAPLFRKRYVVFTHTCTMVTLSEYAKKLPASARSRYEQKVAMCDGKDPLLLTAEETVADMSAYCKVEDVDFKDYFVGKTSFISPKQFKAHISLASITT